MNLSLISIYITSIFFLIITPGPVVALVVNTAAKEGYKKALLTTIGTNWASLVLIAIAVMILAGVLSISNLLLSIFTLLGCLFLCYIGGKSFLVEITYHSENIMLDNEYKRSSKKKLNPGILKGFLVGISNPKDIIFFASFFPQFIHVTKNFHSSVFVLSFLWILMDFSILASYIFLMKGIVIKRYERTIGIISSLFLIFIALLGGLYSTQELFAMIR
ncbi:MAG: Leucine efflux protein [Candidatus Celerinatantimonas neptuna]|nr:MAG: Leucine efflux protein [Candidatus Celerinatantimonas neptuna]